MKENKKFFEVKLHEREIPNKNGQLRKSMRHGGEDWYGNKLVLHTRDTYSGEKWVWLKPEEFESSPKTIFDYVNKQVIEFFNRLPIVLSDIPFNLEKIQLLIKRTYGNAKSGDIETYSYEDDGETRTEGFGYNFYWILPLDGREEIFEETVFNESVVFHLKFNERLHDSRISSRFFSLHFDGNKIDRNNDNMTLNSIITHSNLAKVARGVMQYIQDKDLLLKAENAFNI